MDENEISIFKIVQKFHMRSGVPLPPYTNHEEKFNSKHPELRLNNINQPDQHGLQTLNQKRMKMKQSYKDIRTHSLRAVHFILVKCRIWFGSLMRHSRITFNPSGLHLSSKTFTEGNSFSIYICSTNKADTVY